MAANDYYHDPYMAQSYQPPRQHQTGERPLSHIAFVYNPDNSMSSVDQSRFSQTYNSQQPEPNYYESNDPSRQSQYSDSIPLKQKSKLNTNQGDDWRNQPTQYPPSPDSQNPQLLPNPKAKRKKGFFSGKVPWVVYIVSLVQITVFIVEIIKNCKWFRSLHHIHFANRITSHHHGLPYYDPSTV